MNKLTCWLCWRLIGVAKCAGAFASGIERWGRERVKRLDLAIVNEGRRCRG